MKTYTTYHLFRIHSEDHAYYNGCICYHYRQEKYIYDDVRSRKSMLPYFFHGIAWMGGRRNCQDQPPCIHYIQPLSGKETPHEDAGTQSLDRYIVGTILLSATLTWYGNSDGISVGGWMLRVVWYWQYKDTGWWLSMATPCPLRDNNNTHSWQHRSNRNYVKAIDTMLKQHLMSGTYVWGRC